MKRFTLLLVALLLVRVAAAPAQKVNSHFDPGTDFSKYKTYKWVDIQRADTTHQPIEKQIIEALDAELAKKGLTKSGSDAADLSVAYEATFNKEYPHDKASGDTPSTSKVTVEMHDSAHKAPVWSGTVSEVHFMRLSPDQRQVEITKAIEKLLKNYPSQKK